MDLNTVIANLDTLDKSIDSLIADRDKWKTNSDTMTSNYNSEVTAHNKTKETLKTTQDNLTTMTSNYNNETTAHNKTKETLKTTQTNLTNMTNDRDNLKLEKNRLESQNTSLQSENNNLRYQNSSLQGENNDLRYQNRDLLSQKESLRSQLTNLKQENDRLKDQINNNVVPVVPIWECTKCGRRVQSNTMPQKEGCEGYGPTTSGYGYHNWRKISSGDNGGGSSPDGRYHNWRCSGCGQIYDGIYPPDDHCPVYGKHEWSIEDMK